MSGLPNSLNIALCFVATPCVVGGLAYAFGIPAKWFWSWLCLAQMSHGPNGNSHRRMKGEIWEVYMLSEPTRVANTREYVSWSQSVILVGAIFVAVWRCLRHR